MACECERSDHPQYPDGRCHREGDGAERMTSGKVTDSSFEKMHDAGVSLEDITYAADTTYLAFGVVYHWSYFCGIIWRRVRERDELAQKWFREAHDQPASDA